MKTIRISRGIALAAAIAASLVQQRAALPADISATWNGGGGNWTDPAQWTPAVVPNNGAQTFDASIGAGTATLSGNVALEKLTLSGGTLASPSATPFTVTTNDLLTWGGGAALNSTSIVASNGATLATGGASGFQFALTVPSGKILTSAGGGSRNITRSTITSNGTFQINGLTSFNTGSQFNSFARGTINNAGVMNVAAQTTLTNIIFNNSGSVVLTAPLTLGGGGTWTGGSVTSPSGFGIAFEGGGGHVLDANSSIPGTMPFSVIGGVVEFNFPMTRTAQTTIGDPIGSSSIVTFNQPVSFPAGGSALTLYGNAHFKAGATIDVPLTQYGIARLEGATLNAPWTVSNASGFSGAAAFNGPITNNSTLTKSNTVVFANGTFLNNGTINGGGTFAGGGLLDNVGTVSAPGGATFDYSSNTLNRAGATMTIGTGAAFEGTMTNRGTISVAGPARLGVTGFTTGLPTFHNFGALNVTNGGGITATHLIDNHATITAAGDMSSSGTVAQYTGASLVLNGGAGTLTQTNGTLRAYAAGNGDADDPATAGVFSLTGKLVTTNTKLEVELGGTAQGTQYDFFDIDGAAAVDAAINVRFLNNFQNAVSASDVFTILAADAITSSNLRNPWIGGPPGRMITADGLGSFLVSFTPTSVVLSDFSTAVPEPTIVGPIGGVMTSLAARRRRRRRRVR